MSDVLKSSDELVRESAEHLKQLSQYLMTLSGYLKRYAPFKAVAYEMHENAKQARDFSNKLMVRTRGSKAMASGIIVTAN